MTRTPPLPITVIADSLNVFDSHQIVAFGYDGDPYQGTGKIYVYDNNKPNQECELRLDFTGAELNAQLFYTGNAGDRYEPLVYKSFFCPAYTVMMPPPCLAAQEGLLVFPSPCQSIDEVFYFDFKLINIGYIGNNPSIIVAPVVNFLPDPSSVPANAEVDLAPLTANIDISLNQTRGKDFTSFKAAGVQDAFAKVMIAYNAGNGVENDADGNPLIRIKSLASADGLNASVSQPLNILAAVQVICEQKLQSKCDYWFIPGIAATFKAINPFGNSQVSYARFINGIPQEGQTAQEFTIAALPAAGEDVNVKAEISNINSGCIASGTFSFTVATGEEANRYTLICNFRQKMAGIGILTQVIDPQAPIEETANRLNQGSFKRLKNAFNEMSDELNSFSENNIRVL